MQAGLVDIFSKHSVIPELTLNCKQQAISLVAALNKGGLTVFEISLSSAAAIDIIRALRSRFPELIIGAGSVLSADQYKTAVEAKCHFIVSPGVTPDLLEQALIFDVPFLPGASTLSEIMLLHQQGYKILKYLSVGLSDSLSFISATRDICPQILFYPFGSMDEKKAESLLSLPNVLAIGGSWMCHKQLIQNEDWDVMTQLAMSAAILK